MNKYSTGLGRRGEYNPLTKSYLEVCAKAIPRDRGSLGIDPLPYPQSYLPH